MIHQTPRIENIDHASAVASQREEVTNVECRFPKEKIPALHLQRSDRAENRRDRRRRDIPVHLAVLLAVVIQIIQHSPQILRVDQQQLFLVRDAEQNRQNLRLNLIEPEDPR